MSVLDERVGARAAERRSGRITVAAVDCGQRRPPAEAAPAAAAGHARQEREPARGDREVTRWPAAVRVGATAAAARSRPAQVLPCAAGDREQVAEHGAARSPSPPAPGPANATRPDRIGHDLDAVEDPVGSTQRAVAARPPSGGTDARRPAVAARSATATSLMARPSAPAARDLGGGDAGDARAARSPRRVGGARRGRRPERARPRTRGGRGSRPC